MCVVVVSAPVIRQKIQSGISTFYCSEQDYQQRCAARRDQDILGKAKNRGHVNEARFASLWIISEQV